MGYFGPVLLRGEKRHNRGVPATEPSMTDGVGNPLLRTLDGTGAPGCPPGSTVTSDPTGPSDAERYSAWADRLRDKRTRNQATILGVPADDPWANGYWSTDSVRSSDDPVDEPGIVPDVMRRGRLLSELGLDACATPDEATLAYRSLAKVHHPDRWVEADEATQAHHAEEMLRLNAVYRALRTERPTP